MEFVHSELGIKYMYKGKERWQQKQSGIDNSLNRHAGET